MGVAKRGQRGGKRLKGKMLNSFRFGRLKNANSVRKVEDGGGGKARPKRKGWLGRRFHAER
jgi:hypothetical protein